MCSGRKRVRTLDAENPGVGCRVASNFFQVASSPNSARWGASWSQIDLHTNRTASHAASLVVLPQEGPTEHVVRSLTLQNQSIHSSEQDYVELVAGLDVHSILHCRAPCIWFGVATHLATLEFLISGSRSGT